MVHIRRLREKIEDDPKNPSLIKPYGELDIKLKLNILKSFRVQLAGYAIISCILTFLSDISVIAFIQLVKWNLARITLKRSLVGTPEDIFTIMRQTEPGIWWLLAIITVFCFLYITL